MNRLIVTLESQEIEYDLDQLSLNYTESSDEEILQAVEGSISEQGHSLKSEGYGWVYVVKRVDESQNIYVFPKSPAGMPMPTPQKDEERAVFMKRCIGALQEENKDKTKNKWTNNQIVAICNTEWENKKKKNVNN